VAVNMNVRSGGPAICTQNVETCEVCKGTECQMPIGHGEFCSGGIWMIDTTRDCPICGAGRADSCLFEKKACE
jgi:hypothetical protein